VQFRFPPTLAGVLDDCDSLRERLESLVDVSTVAIYFSL
jgi:hypothetical protein